MHYIAEQEAAARKIQCFVRRHSVRQASQVASPQPSNPQDVDAPASKNVVGLKSEQTQALSVFPNASRSMHAKQRLAPDKMHRWRREAAISLVSRRRKIQLLIISSRNVSPTHGLKVKLPNHSTSLVLYLMFKPSNLADLNCKDWSLKSKRRLHEMSKVIWSSRSCTS